MNEQQKKPRGRKIASAATAAVLSVGILAGTALPANAWWDGPRPGSREWTCNIFPWIC